MTSSTNSKVRRHTPPTRVLAFLLFAIILHGATAELVHKHGGVSPAGIDVNTTASSASNSDNADPSSQQTRSNRECMICQLHQQLRSGLLHSPLFALASTIQFVTIPATATLYLSATSTPRRGRAPPFTSLA